MLHCSECLPTYLGSVSMHEPMQANYLVLFPAVSIKLQCMTAALLFLPYPLEPKIDLSLPSPVYLAQVQKH